MSEADLAGAFDFSAAEREAIESTWRTLMGDAVWLDLHAARVGALPRLRKRILELGETARSALESAHWLPPRERLRSALATTLKLRDMLETVERGLEGLDGGADREGFVARFAELRSLLESILEPREARWAAILEAGSGIDDNEDEAGEDTGSA
ncbi:MAG: hypothetical protein ACOC3U_04750 [Thiohalospira sp.]